MKKLITILSLIFIAQVGLAAITFTPATIDSGYCETAYSCKVTATGGKAPYVYTISAGVLPTGLTINKSTGRISGIIHFQSDTLITFTVRAKDALNATGTKEYTMYITNKVVTWSDIVSYWQNVPNTFPDYTKIYNTWRLNTAESYAGYFWSLNGNTTASLKTFGTKSNYNLPFITNDSTRFVIGSSGSSIFGADAVVDDVKLYAYSENTSTAFRSSSLGDGAKTYYSGYFDAQGTGTTKNVGLYCLARNGTTNNALEIANGNVFSSNAGTSWGLGVEPAADHQFRLYNTNFQKGMTVENLNNGNFANYSGYFYCSGTGNGQHIGVYGRADGAGSQNIGVYAQGSGSSSSFAVWIDGHVKTQNLPTDSTSLTTGEIYNSSGTLKVKY